MQDRGLGALATRHVRVLDNPRPSPSGGSGINLDYVEIGPISWSEVYIRGMVHKGSCLCGGIKYEIHGELTGTLHCHCSMCRKAHGAAFRTRASVRVKDFVWTNGDALAAASPVSQTFPAFSAAFQAGRELHPGHPEKRPGLTG